MKAACYEAEVNAARYYRESGAILNLIKTTAEYELLWMKNLELELLLDDPYERYRNALQKLGAIADRRIIQELECAVD